MLGLIWCGKVVLGLIWCGYIKLGLICCTMVTLGFIWYIWVMFFLCVWLGLIRFNFV